MNLDVDGGTLLYALGVLFAAGALLYFVRDVVFALSVTVKAALLLALFGAFLVAGLVVERDLLDGVAFALSGLSYLTFVGYVAVRYEPGDTGTFLLLAVSGALFVGLGYGVRTGRLAPTRRTARVVLAGLVVLSAVLVGADAATGGVSYDLATTGAVTVEPPADADGDRLVGVEATVGTVTAANAGPFRRPLDLPGVRSCLVGGPAPDRRPDLARYDRTGDRPATVAGGATLPVDVAVVVPVAANRTEPLTVRVERGDDCDRPVDDGETVLHVWLADDDR